MIIKYIWNIKLSIKEERVASASLKCQRKWKSKCCWNTQSDIIIVNTFNHHYPLHRQKGEFVSVFFCGERDTQGEVAATQTQNSDGAAVYYKRDQTLQFDDSHFCGSFYNSPEIRQNHFFFSDNPNLNPNLCRVGVLGHFCTAYQFLQQISNCHQ